MTKDWKQILKRVDDLRWELPRSYKQGMRVPGRIYASEELMDVLAEDQAPEQVANVAFLPGIVGASLAMPDIHWGYGFCIGGVAATDPDEGVVSPGRRGLRHQLRRAAAAHEPRREEDVQPRSAGAGRRAVPRRARRRGRAAGRSSSQRHESRPRC